MRLFAKRSLAVLLSVLMLLSVMMVGTTSAFAAEGDTFYLIPNANWNEANARFAGYFFNKATEKNAWAGATAVEGEDNIYSIAIPEGEWQYVIFCRMNPNNSTNDWSAKWNQTSDLAMPTDGTNCYSITEGSWDSGSWSKYVQGGEIETTVPAPKTYTVAGTSNLCGSEWDPADTANDMTDEDGDGIYTKVYNDVVAGTYKFKVVVNHAWGEEYGDNGKNIEFKVNTGAKVTITFDTKTNTASYLIEGDTPVESESTAAPDPTTVYFVNSGEWAEVYAHIWADGIGTTWPGVAAEKTELTDPNGKSVYSVTFTDAYTNIIFNNGNSGDGNQTGDDASTIQAGYYLNYANQTWYATLEEIPVIEESESTAPAPKTYTVAGLAILCGTEWDPTNTANDMTDEDGDGVYTKVYENVVAGDHQFKVVEDHAWTTSYGDPEDPEGNVRFTVYQSATVTINFDSNTSTVTYEIKDDVIPTTESTVAPDPTTVYFVNAQDWADTIYAYAWDSNKNHNAEWPGVEATKTELTDVNGNAVYTYTVDGAFDKVIFSDGKNQTGDLVVSEGADKYYFINTWYESLDVIPVDAYTICGNINGADTGFGSDANSVVPEYNFVDGTVTIEFTEVSYVCVKTAETQKFFLTKEYVENDTTATLYQGAAERMRVPAGKIKFTLVENEDGTLTLSYEVIELATTETEAPSSETESTVAPNYDGYTLAGYINGEDVGIAGNSGTIKTEYNFVDGTVTLDLTKDSWFCVKTIDNKYTYMTNGMPEEGATSAVLYEEFTLDGKGNKLKAPAGKMKFNLAVNEDGTLTLSYEILELAPTTAPVPKEYMLVGYINGADLGCEEDINTIVPEYIFKDNKLTVTFEAKENYVFIKTTNTDITELYKTEGWLGTEVTEAILYNTDNDLVSADKLFVPGGVEVTFTLVENGDGTLTLSYVAEKPIESESSSSESESSSSESESSSSESESSSSESESTAPSSSETPSGTTDPAESTAPSSLETPSESTAPSSSETPSESTAPSSSETPSGTTDPAESTAPSSSETPSESTAPSSSETPSESTAPSSSETPSESTAPSSSETPSESTAPSSSETPTETTEPTESTAPTTVAKKPAFKYAKKSLKAGVKYTLKVVNASGKKVTSWSSTNTKVATVSSKGIVTALGKGKTTISAKVAGVKIKCTITVTSSPKIYNGKKAVSNNKTINVKKGKTLTLTIKGKASAVNNSYKTSNKKIAKVVSGKTAKKIKIKAYKKGTAKITITVNKKYKTTIKVKVK